MLSIIGINQTPFTMPALPKLDASKNCWANRLSIDSLGHDGRECGHGGSIAWVVRSRRSAGGIVGQGRRSGAREDGRRFRDVPSCARSGCSARGSLERPASRLRLRADVQILILQAMHALSDERCEYLIKDRLSFMRFLGLGLVDPVPDANTIWTFREALKKAAVDGLFQRFDE